MATHYFACSWPTSLAGIRFSQHHMAHKLWSTFSAKALTDLITYIIILLYYSLLEDELPLLEMGCTKKKGVGEADMN
jgi:hypothetical protein